MYIKIDSFSTLNSTPGTAEFSAVYFFCPDDSNCCALLNHNFVVSLTLVRLHARLLCARPPASLTDESLMHMASEAIQCEFGIIVGKLLLALEVAKCRHRSAHGARRQVSGLENSEYFIKMRQRYTAIYG